MRKDLFFLAGGIGIYAAISLWLFHRVYDTTQLVIDEEFHLRQGIHYCNGNFSVWDPKITTFPGLYVYSTVLLMPLGLCEAYYLRLVSFLASILNIYWMYEIRKGILRGKNVKNYPAWGYALDALSLSILPPMYFFTFLYYTDVVSISATLAMVHFSLRRQNKSAATAAAVAVLMRQTNIVWVGGVFGMNVLDKLVEKTLRKSARKDPNYIYSFSDILSAIGFYLKRLTQIHVDVFPIIGQFCGYLFVMVAFVVFVWINGSIVVGDKSAHEATLHLPQIGYFAVFVTFFASGILLMNLQNVLRNVLKRWHVTLLLGLFFLLAVKYNTVVHPYLLADNRHYTFYLWNRFYAKHLARYLAISVYVFGVTSILELLEGQSAGYKLIYFACTIVSIALQSMIEVRYFLIPFLILRLSHAKPMKFSSILLEFAFNIAINIITFYIFFTKTFYWSDYAEPQRIMW
ncbi:putative Dol-P-Glc:Glc(2)Man(9)GlcNAc(2)-PP-Dol alpha-1,2-glucosyltransferase [Phlebotomus argentipes]|uniref:putative Dol-P-Glc:Glc(2)Man(9)GlcNAc(2)-PP-Dol alpha-1,2-glucosyltransferase n=1 Tax=Phlebotomus argentipes TaxID=94469 RepID=UPI00289352E8|nr:putative Dol-P-Glc:Glc(2)Man(9)GlcNAc(2)-PP-Dol alpha-1,2-glucosyltransferase [Phlebotomus argentipes]